MFPIKSCDRYMISNLAERALGGSTVFLVLLKIASRLLINDPDLSGLLGCLYLMPGLLWLLVYLRRKMEGYQLENDKIIFHRFFRKKSLNYSELRCIVISAAWRNTRSAAYIGRTIVRNGKLSVKNYPWITLCKAEPKPLKKRWDCYITYSMFARYLEEIEELIETYQIDKRRIHMIADCVDHKNFYREIDFDKVNAAYFQFEKGEISLDNPSHFQ